LERFPAEINAGFDALLAPLRTAITEARELDGLPTDAFEVDARLVLHQVFGMLIDAAAMRRRVDPDVVVSYTRRAALTQRS
jgi:hypothetical protein